MKAVTAGLLLACVALGALAACVLIEPAQDLPVPAPRRPQILTTSLQPPARMDQPITDLTLTGNFVAFVDAEPSKTLNYRVFVDYTGDQSLLNNANHVDPDPNGNTRREIDFPVSSFSVGDPRFCHTITLFVAYDFIDFSATPAGDSDYVTWYYRPNGALGGCAALDAGVPDAGLTDSGDGATE